MNLNARSFCKVFYIMLPEDSSYAKVVDEQLHDPASLLHFGGVHGTGVKHAACDAPRQRLRRHVVLLGIVYHREPDTKQQRQ